jgi:hypothetical protein
MNTLLRNEASRNWLALHIFEHDASRQDSLLLNWLAPAIRELQEAGRAAQWFFIRYWEGGPHLRVRFLNADPGIEKVLRERIREYARQHPADVTLERDAYYDGHLFDGEPIDPARLPWHVNHSVVRLPYQPEIRRYGGEAALPVSEDLFHGSSELALRVLAANGGDAGKKLQVAMDLMLLTAEALGTTPLQHGAYFHRYAASWQGYVPQPALLKEKVRASFERQREMLVSRCKAVLDFASSEADHPLYAPWRTQLREAVRRLQERGRDGELVLPASGERVPPTEEAVSLAIGQIAWSHLHMTNNRLGVSPALEHYLGTLINLAAEAR